ncbi:MAG TPA: glycosyltransferase family 39 protein [Bryobacteraceae bacterium]|jgi:hypothetical protein|nr:glycosyltransferase family 39 protein [Bryobacteraceae bacterium]
MNKTFLFIRVHSWLMIVFAVFLLRLPFLNQAIQGDDPYYLYGAEHALIDPLHPAHAHYLFQGDLVDMRGFPHPPLNSWILAAPLAVLGEVQEVPFHFRYILWSMIAAVATWSLARRFCERPIWATLLFLAVPAFVVNGNSFESDLPFLAMWMGAIALFVKAVEESSTKAMWVAGIFAALAGLAAYQSILLAPILAVYLIEKRRNWIAGWVVVIAAPLALGAWQIFEWATGGVLPASMLAGYMKTYGLQAGPNKLRSAAALIVHAGWILSPLVVLFLRGPKWRFIVAGAAAAAAAIYDPNPLFWFSFGCGVFLLASCMGRNFLGAWIAIFFLGAAIVFFAGSARYLLPIAAPVAILAVRAAPPRILAAGFALQMTLALGLAIMNYQHWDAYRKFAASLHPAGRVWINAEWGLRYYLESEGGLPLPKGQAMRAGDTVVSSALALPLPVNAQIAPVSEMEIRPAIPLRIISLDGRSAFSSASGRELLPFEISTAPVDRVRAGVVIERKPELTSIDPRDPQAATQIVSGLFPDGWMTDQATIVLKRPDRGGMLRADISIPDVAPARRLTMIVDGQQAGDELFAKAGAYTLAVLLGEGPPTVTVTLKVDKTFSAPGDLRKLGAVVTRVGFR